MTDPMEDIIGQALLGGNYSIAMNRMTCNVAARTQVACTCGEILDQHTIVVVERKESERVVATYCPLCWPESKRFWPEEHYNIITWDGGDES